MLRVRRSLKDASLLVLACLCAVVLLPVSVIGQVTEISNITSTPIAGSGHDYLTDLSEVVNPANGSLSVRIAAPTPARRGSPFPVYAFIYDSNGQWTPQFSTIVQCNPYCGDTNASRNILLYPPVPYPVHLGNQQTGTEAPGTVSYQEFSFKYQAVPPSGPTVLCDYYGGTIVTDFSGGRHALGVSQERLDGSFCSSNDVQVAPAGGDDEYKMYVASGAQPNYAVDLHGNIFDFFSPYYPIEDPNGNHLNTDGRPWAASGGSYPTYDPLTQPTSLTVPGYSTPYTYVYESVTVTPSLNPILRFNDYPQPTWPAYCLETGGSGNPSLQVVKTMTTPTGQVYTFGYDGSTGLLNFIKYPSGASVTYTWGNNAQSEVAGYEANKTIGVPTTNYNLICIYTIDMPAITKRVISYDGVTPAMEQDFSYTTTWNTDYNNWGAGQGLWTSKTTTVTTIDLLRPGHPSFNTVYNYVPMQSLTYVDGASTTFPARALLPIESTIAYHDTSGALLKTVTKVWNTPNQLAAECTTLDNGQTAGTFYQYASYSFGNVSAPRGATFTNLIKDRAEYDYGTVTTPCQQPSSTPLRETKTTYATLGSTPWWQISPAIVDRPQTVQVYGNGTLLSETDYGYDETALAAVSPAPYGHDETNYGPSAATTWARGNATTITKKCFVGSTSCTNSVWKIGYDTTGQMVSVTDANGNITTISYTDNFASGSGTPPQQTNQYATKITKPTTNGVSHIETFQWDYNQGELAVLTDENGKKSYFYYNDPWNRLTEADYPDGGVTKHAYVDTPPISVTTCQLINGSATATCNATSAPTGWVTNVALKDGVGHVIQTQLLSDPDGVTYTTTTYDGIGKPYQVYNPTRCNPPTTNCSSSQSNWGNEMTWGLTTYIYDALGRPCLLVQPDVSGTAPTTCPTSAPAGDVFTSYSANQTVVTDEVGNQRTTQTDALGRVTKVWEAPNATGYNYETDYQYDALGNLLCAVQKGTDTTAFTSCASGKASWRPRSFIYDSLARLLTAKNPESGSIMYSYDLNGNVVARVAPQPNQTGTAQTTTTYVYDALNRLLSITHANPSSANSAYAYDGTAISGCPGVAVPTINSPTNLIGRRSAMCSQQSASSFSYDPMGRIASEVRTNGQSAPPPITHTTGYQFYLDGSLKTLTYPSGDVVTYTVGGAGRVTQVSDTANTFVALPATLPMYAAHGALFAMTQGSGMVTKNVYNDRLQPLLLLAGPPTAPVFSLCYDFHLMVAVNNSHLPCQFSASTIGDNGNVFQVIDNIDSTHSATFAYDPLNRIKQANTVNTTSNNCWGEAYTIDTWGNMTNIAGAPGMGGNCSTETLNAGPTSASNGLNGYCYDAAGNLVLDNTCPSGSFTPKYYYDSENRLYNPTAPYTYMYDAGGVRIRKAASATVGTFYWPGPGGEYLTEANGSGVINEEYIYFNGERIARIDRPSGTVHYYFSDELKSASTITDPSGNVQEHYYYYPYGGLVASIGSDTNHYLFTGKERDNESGEFGLDMFGARYYGSNMGRFMTPDPHRISSRFLINPQLLNFYAYVGNSPLSFFDPDGLERVGSFSKDQWMLVSEEGGLWTLVLGFFGGHSAIEHNSKAFRPEWPSLGQSKSPSPWVRPEQYIHSPEGLPLEGAWYIHKSSTIMAIDVTVTKDSNGVYKVSISTYPSGDAVAFSTEPQFFEEKDPMELSGFGVKSGAFSSLDQAALNAVIVEARSKANDPVYRAVYNEAIAEDNRRHPHQPLPNGASYLQQDRNRLCGLGNAAACSPK